MKIVFITRGKVSPASGGIERVTWVLSRHFKKQGHELSFLYFGFNVAIENNEEKEFQEQVLPDRAKLYCRQNLEFLSGLLKTAEVQLVINQGNFEKGLVRLITETCASANCQLISVFHSAWYNFTTFSSVYAFRLRAGKLTVKRGLAIILFPLMAVREYYNYQQAIKRAIRQSEFFVAPAQGTIDRFRKKWSTSDDSTFRVIPNPLSFENPTLSATKKKEVLYVGRLERNSKRIDRLIRIWALIEDKFPDWSLHIVGGSSAGSPDRYQDAELERLQKLSGKLNLRRVLFEGRQNPVPYYETASVLCLTSSHEGFGLVLTEAMQHGVVPVVFNSFAACAEIIDHGQNGLLVEPFDLNAFAASLGQLMKDENYRTELSRKAIEKADLFRIEVIAAKWNDLFKQLIAR